MKKILDIFEIANLIGLIIVSLLIGFVGPFIKIGGYSFLESKVVRLEIISLLFIFWIIKILVSFLLEIITTKKIIKGLIADQPEKGMDPKILKHNILFLIHTLYKKSFWSSQKRIYTTQLPLFIIIGAPGAGKTSMLAKAGIMLSTLDIHLQKIVAELKKMNAGDWWITQEGVFIEINTETDNLNTLTLLLKIFKRYKFRHFFQGIIVVEDGNYLVSLTEESQITTTNTLNVYLAAIYETLKTRVPLYLMMTKMDQVSGFNEYLSTLSPEERELPFGYTLQESNVLTLQHLLNIKHDLFVSQLQKNSVKTINFDNPPSFIGRGLNFPQQLYVMKGMLQKFIKTLLSFESFESPYTLFGIYFSSAATTTSPSTDYYFSSLKNALQLTNNDIITLNSEPKSYFLKGFFKKHIFVGSCFTVNKQRQYILLEYLRKILLVFLSGSLFVYASYSCFSGFTIRNHVKTMQTTLASYHNNMMSPHPKSNLIDALPQLEPIRILMEKNNEDIVWYQPYTRSLVHNTNSKLEDILSHALTLYYVPLLFKRVEFLLEQEMAPTQNLINYLKAYLGFSNQTKIKQKIIHTVLSQDIFSTYKNDISTRDKLIWYLTKTSCFALSSPDTLNQRLILDKKNILKCTDPLERIYTHLKAYADQQNPRFLVPANAWDPFFRQVFDENQTAVPILYTVNGYTSIFKIKLDPFIDEILSEDLQIGFTDHNTAHTKESITSNLVEVYSKDYLTQWQYYLQHLKIIPTHSLEDLVKIIGFLSGKTAILSKIIELSGTEIYPITLLTTDSSFKELVDFVELNHDQGLPVLKTTMTHLGQLAQSLTSLLQASDSDKACFLYAKAYLQENSENPLFILKETANQLPSPLKIWIQEIIKRTWNHIFHPAMCHIDTIWKTNTYPLYEKTFSHTYPFIKSSTQDLDFNDFKSFFGVKGTLETFFDAYLSSFIHVIDQESPSPYKGPVNSIQNALLFKERFFSNAELLSIPFQIESFTMDTKLASLSFSYAGNNLTYRHGPTLRKKFIWPNSDLDNNTCEITGINFDQREDSHRFDGLWGIFKLLDHCNIKFYKDEKNVLLTLPLQNSAQLTLISPKLLKFREELRALQLPVSLHSES
jgi:type VI secretion system protein ImpL